jgi:hypothetical protein
MVRRRTTGVVCTRTFGYVTAMSTLSVVKLPIVLPSWRRFHLRTQRCSYGHRELAASTPVFRFMGYAFSTRHLAKAPIAKGAAASGSLGLAMMPAPPMSFRRGPSAQHFQQLLSFAAIGYSFPAAWRQRAGKHRYRVVKRMHPPVRPRHH